MIQYRVNPNYTLDRHGAEKGFKLAMVTAYNEDKEVGYLKIGFLYKKDFIEKFSTIWHYEKHWKGKLHINLESNNFQDHIIEQYRSKSFINRLSPKNKVKEFNRIKKELTKKRYKDLLFFLDKPYVIMVSVNEGYRKQGIARKLYLEAQEFLNKSNQSLHSDSSQTVYAKKCWERFYDEGLAKKCYNSRRFKFKL